MDFYSPYRVAWRPPPPVNVRSASRKAVLEALEFEFPTSKSRLAQRSGLGETTVRRAGRQLAREKVTSLSYGRDPDTGVSVDLITFAIYPVLPVLEITPAYMIWRLCNTRGDSVFATVRDRGGFCTPEEDFSTLMGQVATITKAGTCGLPSAVPLQPPVLLLPARDPAMEALIRREIGCEPAYTLTPEAAAAHELRYHALTQSAASILYIRAGENSTASLLQRADMENPRSPFRPSPWTDRLGDALHAHIRDLTPHTEARWQATADFLADCCRFISPEIVLVESDRPIPDVSVLRHAIPSDSALHCLRYALNSPSLAHRGALRLTRQDLWASMESVLPKPAKKPVKKKKIKKK